LLREGAAPDVGEDLTHALADPVVDHTRSALIVAPLGGVGDAEAHPRQAALVYQIDDELQLVQALEVRDLGLVPGFDERLVAALHELGDAAAQDRLLAEEVGLGLLLERGLDDPWLRGADPGAVGKRALERLP